MPNVRQRLPPQFGRAIHLQEQHRQRPPGKLRCRTQVREFAGTEIGIHLQHPSAGGAHSAGHGRKLGIAR